MRKVQEYFEFEPDDLLFVRFKQGRRDPVAVEFILLNKLMCTVRKDQWEHWPEISTSRNKDFLIKNGGIVPHTIMFGPKWVECGKFYRVKRFKQLERVAFVQVADESFTYKELKELARQKNRLFWRLKFLDTHYGRVNGIWEAKEVPSIDWGGPIYPWDQQFYQWAKEKSPLAIRLLNGGE